MCFATMLKQEAGWFDQEKNSIGALGVRLSSDCGAVQGVMKFSIIIIYKKVIFIKILLFRQQVHE